MAGSAAGLTLQESGGSPQAREHGDWVELCRSPTEARKDHLVRLGDEERLAFTEWLWGSSPIDAECFLESAIDLLGSVPAEHRLAACFGVEHPASALGPAYLADGYAASEGLSRDRRIRLLGLFREGSKTDGYSSTLLTSSMAGIEIESGRTSQALALVEAHSQGLVEQVQVAPLCVPPSDPDRWLNMTREAYQQMVAVGGHALVGLGAPDEAVVRLRSANAMLKVMRASQRSGETMSINRAAHGDVIDKLASAYLQLERFGPASELLEQALADRSIFEAGDPTTDRVDTESRLWFSLALARIGSSHLERDPARRRTRNMASEALEHLLGLEARAGQFQVGVDLVIQALVWRTWLALETDASEAEEWLVLVQERVAQRGENSLPPPLFRQLRTVQTRHARLRTAEGGPENRTQRATWLREALESFEAQWEESDARESGLGVLNSQSTWELIGEQLYFAEEELEPRDAIRSTLDFIERMRILGSQPRLLGAKPASWLAAAKNAEQAGGGLLVAIPTGVGPLRIFLVDEEKVTSGWTAPLVELEELALGYYGRLGQQPLFRGEGGAGLREDGVTLRNALLDRRIIERMLELERVTAIGFDLIGPQPLSSLPIEEDGWLGTRLGLVELPSLSVGGALLQRARTLAPERLVFVSNPETGSAETDLHIERARLAAMGETFHTDSMFGPDAGWNKVVEQVGRDGEASALLFVTHGGRAAGFVRPFGLHLTAQKGNPHSGLLLANQVEAADLSNVPLVILATCNAGKEPPRIGDAGSASLPGAFLRAGASATLSASGDLPVDATLELLEVLLREWSGGAALDMALRNARRHVASIEAWSDPFFHAQLRLASAPMGTR